MAENKYGVAKKQWKKGNEQEQQAFLDLYESMMENPDLYTRAYMHEDWWNEISWNAAWMSADLLRFNRKFNG